jgi:undecaprenyl diphosphate synthase
MDFDFTIQRTSTSVPLLHAAIIMDGNGRWASAHGLPRLAGHRAGADAVRRAVEACPPLGIGALTLYAFSSDNWRRPPDEVDALMHLLGAYLESETPNCVRDGVRLELIGRRDRLAPSLLRAVDAAEAATRDCRTLHLRVAVDYSARDQILRAAAAAAGNGGLSRDGLSRHLGPEVDLLIRTGGEQRLSDFLLWECAYAELIFSRRMWPEFDGHDLAAAVREFRRRERRFGGLPAPAPVAAAVMEHAPRWLE